MYRLIEREIPDAKRIRLFSEPNNIDIKMDQQKTLAVERKSAIGRPPPAIFKLNIDCFEKIFDYLSLADLVNMAQTCKLMHKVAGHIIQLQYPFVRVFADEDRIFLRNHNEVRSFANIFIEHIQIAMFKNNVSHALWHQFKSIKIAHFHYAQIQEAKINMMTDMLRTVELAQFTFCQFDDGMFEYLLDKCPNIKTIAMTFAYNCGVNWLHQKYPSLERVLIFPILDGCCEIKELAGFFELNPNVRKFQTSSKFILKNEAFVKQARFDELTIIIDDMDLDSVCVSLNELHSNGVYKVCYITFFEYLEIKQPLIDQLHSIKGLDGLSVPFNVKDADLRSFVNLETLQFSCNVNQILNMPQLPQYLINLTEISFYKAEIDDILPFVHQLTKLRKIAIARSDNNNHTRGIDLIAVNKMREKVRETTAYVSKVFIYVPEPVYLAIRSKSITMIHDLVEVQRYDQYNYVRFWNWIT